MLLQRELYQNAYDIIHKINSKNYDEIFYSFVESMKKEYPEIHCWRNSICPNVISFSVEIDDEVIHGSIEL